MINMKKMEKVIAENIKFYMELKELQQKDIAKRIGVSPSTVSYWLHGTQMPRTDKIDSLCELLGVEREQLLLPKEDTEKALIINEINDIAKNMDAEQLEILLKMAKAMEE